MLPLREVCFCLLLLSLATAAPLQKGEVPSTVSEVEEQEEELQSLLHLAEEKSEQPDVTVHEEHTQHVHEINGEKTEVDTARKIVSNTETGKVLADVKQEVSVPEQSANAAAPEVEVKTEVDVPDEGVHETFLQSGAAGEQEQEPAMPHTAEEEAEREEEEEIEFSPEAVAEYLMKTGDYDRFYSALAQLVNASIMTEEEAQSYSQLVALEYDRLQMEEYENSIMVQRREPQLLERYPMAAMDAPYGYYPAAPMVDSQEAGYPVALETPEELLALEQAQMGVPKEDFELDPYDLLSALWSEAYGAGDIRAQELVGELFNKVRGDNDPNDEAQVRDILLDLIANSVMNEEARLEQPQYAWQPMVDEEGVPNGNEEEEEELEEEMMAPVQPFRQQQQPRPLPAAAVRPAYRQPIINDDDEEAMNELLGHTEEQKRTVAGGGPEMKADKKPEAAQAAASSDDVATATQAPQQVPAAVAVADAGEAAKSESGASDKQEEEKNSAEAPVAVAPALPSAEKRAKETV